MTKKNRKHSAGIVLRDILLALLLVAVVAASAILVYRRFFESGTATPDEKQNIAKNHYDADSFYEENGMLRYAKSAHLTGVDVSEHQEKIDWAAVRAAGVDFAILRIGYRGYTEGSLREDSWFAENYTAARAAGVQVGVYFFSQAMTLEEAREEANYTLELLGDRTLELPVFYRVERTGRRLGAGLRDVAWFAPEQPRGNARPVSPRYGQRARAFGRESGWYRGRKSFVPRVSGGKAIFLPLPPIFEIRQIFT